MGKIHVLPEILAHKIAAGEIVERPASVVKELVENSLDAGSTRILVHAESGGKHRISVHDNGAGMSPEDAEAAFQHHATSKLRTFDDLLSIGTLGFRGEALPSIASVSRLRLRTVERDRTEGSTPLGTELQFEGGKKTLVREISWPEGTEIEVEDLFFNVPARRNFLRTEGTELGHITRQVVHYSLAYPEVEFRLQHQGNAVLANPAVDNLEDRIYQLMGEQFLENLVPVDYERDSVHIHGFTSLPHEQRSNSRSQYLFVNRRVVRDRVVTHAVRQAYQDLIPASAHPVLILFVDIDPREVDVNVHPSKVEIRFRNSDRVHRAIYHGIEEALVRSRSHFGALARDLSQEQFRVPRASALQGVARSIDQFFRRQPDSSMGFPQLRESVGFGPPSPGSVPDPAESRSCMGPTSESDCSEIPETAHISAIPVVLGQFVESFIVASDREGVMLVDQHVAHERILFDKAVQRLNSKEGSPIQRLLIPRTVELTAEQASVMSHLMAQLNANGFEVEWFGDRTVVVKGVPDFVAHTGDIEALLERILGDLGDFSDRTEQGVEIQRLREKLAISLSCRAAVKINTPLSMEKMQWMLDALFRCRNPFTCPHGRPIVLRLHIEDVLKTFKRI